LPDLQQDLQRLHEPLQTLALRVRTAAQVRMYLLPLPHQADHQRLPAREEDAPGLRARLHRRRSRQGRQEEELQGHDNAVGLRSRCQHPSRQARMKLRRMGIRTPSPSAQANRQPRINLIASFTQRLVWIITPFHPFFNPLSTLFDHFQRFSTFFNVFQPFSTFFNVFQRFSLFPPPRPRPTVPPSFTTFFKVFCRSPRHLISTSAPYCN
jgi:hypothetical protein